MQPQIRTCAGFCGIRKKMIDQCSVCGGRDIRFRSVLWKDLTDQWGLAPDEVHYIDRQQGMHCAACGCNFRTMALAVSIMRSYVFCGTFQAFVRYPEVRELK